MHPVRFLTLGDAMSDDTNFTSSSSATTTTDVDNEYDDYYYYSSSQDAYLKTAPRITSTLSILGTIWIVLEVFYYCPNKRFYVYHKLVSAMAMYCLLTSIWYFISNWATSSTTGGEDSSTSSAFCQAQGFFIQLSVGPALYYCMLFLYYLLVICHSYSEERLRQRSWEVFFHTLPLAFSVITSSTSISLNLFHPTLSMVSSDDDLSSPWCWIAPSGDDHYDTDGDDEFISTYPFNRIGGYQWGFYLGPAWLSLICMVVALIGIFKGVQVQEVRMMKYMTAGNIRKIGKVTATTTISVSSSLANNTTTLTAAAVANSRAESNMTLSVSTSTRDQQIQYNPHRHYYSHPMEGEGESTSRNYEEDNSSSHPPDEHDGDRETVAHYESENNNDANHDNHSNNNYNRMLQTGPLSLSDRIQQQQQSVPGLLSSSIAGQQHQATAGIGHRIQKNVMVLVRYEQMREYWDHRPRTRQVVVQALCYVGAFFWSNIFLTINQLIVWSKTTQQQQQDGSTIPPSLLLPYALVALQVTCQPLQGFLIFLAYRRPTYMRLRRKGLSRWRSLMTSLQWNETPIDPPSSSRGSTKAGSAVRLTRMNRRGHGGSVGSSTLTERRNNRAQKSTLTTEEKDEGRRLQQEGRLERKRIWREKVIRQEGHERQKQQQGLDQQKRPRRILPQMVQRCQSEPVDLYAVKGDQNMVPRKVQVRIGSSSFLRFLGARRAEERDELDGTEVNQVPAVTMDVSNKVRLETLEEVLQRSRSEPNMGSPSSDGNSDDDDVDDDGKGWSPKRPVTETGHDSYSTQTTRRTSGLTKGESSGKFELLQKEQSLRMTDLFQDSMDDDDGSFSLEEMVGGSLIDDDDSGDADDGNRDTIHNDHQGPDDGNALHDSARRRRGFGFFGRRRQFQEDVDSMLQHSDRYMDLVCMDIIPEADGAIEEKWRAIEARVGRYEKTRHEKHKLNMSLPVLSDRSLSGYPPPPPPLRCATSAPHPSPEGTGKTKPTSNLRHGWSKLSSNPLFKISGRWKVDCPSDNIKERKIAPPPTTSGGSSDDKREVARTSSGGYFIGPVQGKVSESAFWDKLELEKKRKEMLKEISSRPVSDEDATEEGIQSMPPNSDATAGGQQDSSVRSPTIYLEGCDDYDVEARDTNDKNPSEELTPNDHITTENSLSRFPTFGMERARREIMNTVSRIANRALYHIPEVSEHSEATRKDDSCHDDPPKQPARWSSSEQSSIGEACDAFERSNEMTIRSSGSSKRTVQHSNRRQSDQSLVDDGRRRSSMSGISSEEFSMVSESPLSDDEGFLSDSSTDSVDHDDDKPKRRGSHGSSGGKRNGPKDAKVGDKKLRDSLSELQRLSERSFEEMGESSNSFHIIDTGHVLLDTNTKTDDL